MPSPLTVTPESECPVSSDCEGSEPMSDESSPPDESIPVTSHQPEPSKRSRHGRIRNDGINQFLELVAPPNQAEARFIFRSIRRLEKLRDDLIFDTSSPNTKDKLAVEKLIIEATRRLNEVTQRKVRLPVSEAGIKEGRGTAATDDVGNDGEFRVGLADSPDQAAHIEEEEPAVVEVEEAPEIKPTQDVKPKAKTKTKKTKPAKKTRKPRRKPRPTASYEDHCPPPWATPLED